MFGGCSDNQLSFRHIFSCCRISAIAPANYKLSVPLRNNRHQLGIAVINATICYKILSF